MKLFEQRTVGGQVIGRYWRPENGYGNKPAGHDFLHGPADDEYGELKVGEGIKFSGQSFLVRVQ
jgi:hypothetical protein